MGVTLDSSLTCNRVCLQKISAQVGTANQLYYEILQHLKQEQGAQAKKKI